MLSVSFVNDHMLTVFFLIHVLAWVGSTPDKVMEIFSAGSQLYVGGDFLSQNSQHLGQQVKAPSHDKPKFENF